MHLYRGAVETTHSVLLTFARASLTAFAGSLPSASAAALVVATPGGGGVWGRNLAVRRQCGKLFSHLRQEKSPSTNLLSSTQGSPTKALPIFLSIGPKLSKSSSAEILLAKAAYEQTGTDGKKAQECLTCICSYRRMRDPQLSCTQNATHTDIFRLASNSESLGSKSTVLSVCWPPLCCMVLPNIMRTVTSCAVIKSASPLAICNQMARAAAVTLLSCTVALAVYLTRGAQPRE